MVYVRTQAWQKLAFRALRRWESEFESLRLRRVAKRWFNLQVGLYSYGCFDPDRFPPGTTIGRYCSIARSAWVFDTDHPTDCAILHPISYHPGFGLVTDWRIAPQRLTIGDDVWIGHNACILASAKEIGRGAVIAAGAVVTKPVSPYSIVAGIPAKPLRMRLPESRIKYIEKSRWWELNIPELRVFLEKNPGWLDG